MGNVTVKGYNNEAVQIASWIKSTYYSITGQVYIVHGIVIS